MSIFIKIANFFLLATFFYFCGDSVAVDGAENEKIISLADDESIFENISSQAGTVENFLQEQKIDVSNGDYVFPSKDAKIFSGSRIIISRAKNITIAADGKTEKFNVYGRNIASALWENNIKLGEDDFTIPVLNYPLRSGDKIEVVRVDIKEEIVKKDIPYGTKENKDDELGWRVRKITQKGEKGIKEITYKVVSYNSKEISRKIINESVVREPVTEIVTQGTYVKLGKSHSGMASWYSYTGGMTAANPWLPLGSYVKVTNRGNGKSVIVKIVDRGPWGKGRIIDLEKTAFAKIADLGAGVVEVKMEEIVN